MFLTFLFQLELLRSLILWSLSSSEAIQAKIKESYKQARHDDDLNQPLSVQPWGRDSLKRRYWLIEGQDDTNFRLYRESNPALKNVTWRSVAGEIPEMQAVANKLHEEKGINSKKLSERIQTAIPRFEVSEDVSSWRTSTVRKPSELTICSRNASAVNTELPAKLRSFDQTPDFPCMKAAPAARN